MTSHQRRWLTSPILSESASRYMCASSKVLGLVNVTGERVGVCLSVTSCSRIADRMEIDFGTEVGSLKVT